MSQATEYKLINVLTGRVFEDAGWCLDDPQATEPSLVRAQYAKRQITFGPQSEGLYRFADWLPISRRLKGSSAPITYKSKGLAKELGMTNLYITFSGYHPAVGANITTCAFKETEAYSVCGRMSDRESGRVLVVASAGNTARAFAKVCSENNIPLLLCVPEDNLNALWFEKPINDCVKLVASESGADYFDAIHVGNIAVKSPKFYAEGGAKNVARRDGMATTVLSAVEVIGHIPDYYFQAVGSGTGAIAAWEANLRLIADGRWGDNKMRLMMSQNYPFIPMYDAWKAHSRAMLPLDDDKARKQVEEIDAKVLSNRRPPYPVHGGLFDAMCDSKGEFYHADNTAARNAAELFEKTEGIDIHPAAAVAVASMIDCLQRGEISGESVVMLNITGGGEKAFKKDKKLYSITPSLIVPINPNEDAVIKAIESMY